MTTTELRPEAEAPPASASPPSPGRPSRPARGPGHDASSPADAVAGRFVAAGEHADVAVVLVTYRSADHLGELIASLRIEAGDSRLRVIVADNASTDGTVALVRAHGDVVLVETGGNLGYAGAINAASHELGDADAILVLNPDLVVVPGCILALRAELRSSGAGVVVPRILDADGHGFPSLRREPTLLGALGDALLGNRLAGRPGTLSESVFDPAAYERTHDVDWATGAALLIDRRAADAVGAWDERFFLYSEETDFLRRVRETGRAVRYTPAASVRHSQGGSGTSADLDRLQAVNRIRYARKYHSRAWAAAFRAAVVLHELTRVGSSRHRAVLRAVASEASWSALPRARAGVSPERLRLATGSIVIPAHNESAVIARTLRSIAPLALAPGIEVIVSANGCSDDTARIARGFAGVTVIEIDEASKPAALDAADAVTSRWPRLYLDADIEIDPIAALDVFDRLAGATAPLAARPAYRWDLDGATRPVRAYYRARARLHSTRSALWGAGAYALGAEGRSRFDGFPRVTADDLFVDRCFAGAEKEIVETEPVRVRVPRTTRDLLRVLRRQARGPAELGATTSRSTLGELVRSVRGPRSLTDALWYAGFATMSRAGSRSGPNWERDSSSRVAPSMVADGVSR